MADSQQSPMDRADGRDMTPIGGTTAGVQPGSDPTRTGGIGTPGAELGVPTPGTVDPRGAPAPTPTGDVGMGGDPADVGTQVDGAYGGDGGGTGAAGGLGGPDVVGGVGGSLGGMSGGMSM